AGGARGFRRERAVAGGPAAGRVYCRELLRRREARNRGAWDARFYRHLQRQSSLRPDDGDGLSEHRHRGGGVDRAGREEPFAGRNLRWLPSGDAARGFGDRYGRHRPGRDGLQHHPGRPLRSGGALRPRTRRLPRGRGGRTQAVPRPHSERGFILRPGGGPASTVALSRGARGGDGGVGDLYSSGDAGGACGLSAYGLGRYRLEQSRAHTRQRPKRRRGRDGDTGARDPRSFTL
ncbi:MAG: Purine nucleoside phosphorylase, partial [uncultured Rubrobacteraceae bacterium]